ncbi:MAG: thiol:disulfide interchange protein DsbA/DsbL [Halioglobus sp.]|nr:thiol:disulfide interchange protein DsbA/DsbL [Halioglobus sp.]
MIKQALLTVSLLVFGIWGAVADEAAKTYVAGTDYDVISPPVRAVDQDKIEVAEFFWYGCSHCYAFEPMLEQWKKTLPADVSFRGVPAVWQDKMELHARAYYTAEALGVLDTMQMVIFQAMNVDRKQLSSQAEIAALFVANGVSEEDFNKAFNSFGVKSQVSQAVATGKAAKLEGTPALMVNGKYYISSRKAGSQANMLKVADFLIAQERAAAGS